jgi:hypothetical protein
MMRKPNRLGLQVNHPKCAYRLHDVARHGAQQFLARLQFRELFVALWQRAEHVNIHDPIKTPQSASESSFYDNADAYWTTDPPPNSPLWIRRIVSRQCEIIPALRCRKNP